MAYKCPRCGESVERAASSAATIGGGLVGALIVSAFGAFQCKKCGKIASREFPAEVRRQMTMGSVTMVVVACMILVGVIAVLAAFQS